MGRRGPGGGQLRRLPRRRPSRCRWHPESRRAAVQGGLALVIAGSLAMAGPVPLWMPGRMLAGSRGALLFLAGSAKAAAGLEWAGRGPLAGIGFAGSGWIALGACCPSPSFRLWRWGWLLGGLAAAACWPLLAERGPARPRAGAAAGRLAWDRPLLALSVAYACAGLAFAAGSTFFVRAVTAFPATDATPFGLDRGRCCCHPLDAGLGPPRPPGRHAPCGSRSRRSSWPWAPAWQASASRPCWPSWPASCSAARSSASPRSP